MYPSCQPGRQTRRGAVWVRDRIASSTMLFLRDPCSFRRGHLTSMTTTRTSVMAKAQNLRGSPLMSRKFTVRCSAPLFNRFSALETARPGRFIHGERRDGSVTFDNLTCFMTPAGRGSRCASIITACMMCNACKKQEKSKQASCYDLWMFRRSFLDLFSLDRNCTRSFY
jgi:hypothetical protein